MNQPQITNQRPWFPWCAILPTGVVLPLSGITSEVLQDDSFGMLFGGDPKTVSRVSRIRLMVAYAGAAAETTCLLQRIANCK